MLAPREVNQAQEQGHGLLVSGKIQGLENSFFEAGYDFVGVQEVRIRIDCDVKKITIVCWGLLQPMLVLTASNVGSQCG